MTKTIMPSLQTNCGFNGSPKGGLTCRRQAVDESLASGPAFYPNRLILDFVKLDKLPLMGLDQR